MLKPLIQFRTSCCDNDNTWQYSIASRTLPCQFCGTIGDFKSLPREISPPISNAHTPLYPGNCPIRVVFIPSNQNRGFLNYELGDELHCGLVDTSGCVKSFIPKEKRFRSDRKNIWKQSILCEISEIKNIDGLSWNKLINEVVSTGPPDDNFDCLDFAVEVLNKAATSAGENNIFTREKLSEIMGRQLYHVMEYAKIQKKALEVSSKRCNEF